MFSRQRIDPGTFFSIHFKAFLFLSLGLMAVSCRSERSVAGSTAASGEARVTALVQSSNVDKDKAPKVESVQDRGDRLPIVVDPNSPGSCALVAKGDMCGECCSDVFAEDSEQWHTCMNACVKEEAVTREH